MSGTEPKWPDPEASVQAYRLVGAALRRENPGFCLPADPAGGLAYATRLMQALVSTAMGALLAECRSRGLDEQEAIRDAVAIMDEWATAAEMQMLSDGLLPPPPPCPAAG